MKREGVPGALKRFLRRLGEVQAALLLTAVYLLVWLPAGGLCRLFSDWLNRRPSRKATLWFAKAERVNDPRTLRDPY